MKTRIFSILLLALGAAACQSPGQQLDSRQDEAINTAVARAKFDMNCPAATGEVLSRSMIQPVSMRFGIERAEYTVGIEGCGQKQTMVVICPMDGSGCIGGGARE